jgi:hypothetical protein
MQLDRHIAIWAGWIAGPAFGLAMMAAPDYLHLSHYWAGICFWGGISVFVLTIAVVVCLSLHEKDRQRRIVGPLMVMALGATVFLCGAAWYFWPAVKTSDAEAESKRLPLDQTILAECYWSQPPASVPSYGLYYFQLAGRSFDGALVSSSFQPGSPANFPKEFTYFVACKLSNYSDKQLTGVELNLHLDYRLAIKNSDGRNTSGDIVFSRDLPSPPIFLGTGDKNEFIFYLTNYNNYDYFINIKVPSKAKVRIAGSDKLELVDLIPAPSSSIYQYPLLPPYVPPPATNPPPATPPPPVQPKSPGKK